MTKLLKISARLLGLLLEWALIFLIVFAFAIRSGYVQTYLAQKATNYLSKELKTTVKIDAVKIVFIDQVAIDGVLIKDLDNDTLLSVDRLLVKLDELKIKQKKFSISEATLKGGFGHIKRYTDNTFNHSFIRDYFVKGPSKKNTIQLRVDKVSIENTAFKYDDLNKPILDYGVDYFHIYATNIYATADNIKVNKSVITGDITSFSANEKGGIKIKNLITKANVSPKGVKLSNTSIKTAKSKIYSSKFNMLSQTWTSFKYFVDSVTFDSKIDSSSVALDEAALFGYALRGMNDQVSLSTELHNKTSALQIKNFDLKYAESTNVKGTISLADYREFSSGILHDIVDYAYVDLQELNKLKLPNSMSSNYFNLSQEVLNFDHFEVKDLRIDGVPNNFVVESDLIATGLGSVNIRRGLMFTYKPSSDSYAFSKASGEKYDVTINELQLSSILKNKDFGILSGDFSFDGEYFSPTNIVFNNIIGDVGQFGYLGYNYQNITITEGEFKEKVFNGKIDIKDDNLDLVYDGFIDFKGQQQMVFSIDIANAILDNLGFSTVDSKVRSNINFSLSGKSSNNIEGNITINSLVYTRNQKEIEIPQLNLNITRSASYDQFIITSNALDAKIVGKLNANNFYNDFMYQLGHVFPSLINIKELDEPKDELAQFTYDIKVKQASELIGLFTPDFDLAPGTTLNGKYFGKDSEFTTIFNSDSVRYKDMVFKGFNLNQVIDSNSINSTIHIDNYKYNDSLQFADVYFKTIGGKDRLENILSWEGNTANPSYVNWNTDLYDWDHYRFILEPSYFYIKGHRWDIAHKSTVNFEGDTIKVDQFDLTRNDQNISINGLISNNPSHHLIYEINDLEVEEFSGFITSDYPMSGKLNAGGYIATPFTDFMYSGDASLMKFNVKNQSVGDIFFQSEYQDTSKSIVATGDLIYKGNKTFHFSGDYNTKLKEDNLNFDLDFDFTDIQFVNAFMDPDVMTDIRGILDGNIALTGSPTEPELDGIVNLYGGSAFFDILGVHFGIEGPIEIDKYGFYMNNIPVYDEEANAGYLIGSVFHDNFADFNFDLQFDLERDAINKDPINPWMPVPLKQFLVMNLPYDQDSYYYGIGYATGTANIFGYTDNLEITVDMTTQEGTLFNLPMYGVGEIEDDIPFITFKDELIASADSLVDPKFDFTGVTLDLNFNVNPKANARIIFNEDIGDIISANGNGLINITLDNLGEIRMSGTYTVKDGAYDFAMGPVKQKFFIKEGGTISWAGDPYNADLNLQTYYKVNANIADISQDQLGSGTGAHQNVLCYLNLTESLLKPSIEFDIQAPQANDIARSLINRITSDKDELNRQFFSLLLWKRFQPLAVGTNVSGSAAADLITNQINSMLSLVSSDYNLNVAYDNDKLTGDSQYEFGISKGFLDDRLILSGSFGVENTDQTDGSTHSNLIGDLNLEYLLNEPGTFRINIFNESTDKTVIQQGDLGYFTQGAGLTYKEDFNNSEDFKIWQSFLDIFRKKENKRYLKRTKKQKRKVPPPDYKSHIERNED